MTERKKAIPKRRPCPDIRLWRGPPDPLASGRRARGAPRANIRHRCGHHSPAGWEWGYRGSGPADLALSIMNLCLPVGCDRQPPQKLFHGRCSLAAWLLHQHFKEDFLAAMPHEGGTIKGNDVDLWINAQLEILLRNPLYEGDGLGLLVDQF